MLLAINANNTTTLLGLCDPDGEGVLASWRVSTRRERLGDEWYALVTSLLATAGHDVATIRAMVLGSVVPTATTALATMARSRLRLEPLVVGPETAGGVRATVDNPREVGPDRLANTAAAFSRYGGPAIVVDFGTATNFDVVSAEGAFAGGAIAPGLMVSLDALTGRAARLYAVDLALPERAIGTNTTSNLQAGAVLGHLAMVEGLIGRIRAELAADAPAIATGGLAPLFIGASPAITHHAPDLTLDGLRLIFRRETGRDPVEAGTGAPR
jgi:type III pantothenate kinase